MPPIKRTGSTSGGRVGKPVGVVNKGGGKKKPATDPKMCLSTMATRKGTKKMKSDAIPGPGTGKPVPNFTSPMGGMSKAAKSQKLSRKPRAK